MAANDSQPPGLRANQVALPNVDDASSQALSEALSSSFVLVRLLVAALCIGFLFSCVFQVKQNEVAIILRFGSPVGATPSEQVLRAGLHWALPYPIDEIVKIPVGESRSVRSTTGWYLQSDAEVAAGQKPEELNSLTPGRDSYVLTGDGNILHVRATLFYRLSDPVAHTFNFGNPTNLLVNCLNNAIHWAAVRTTADNALYQDVAGFQSTVRGRVSELIDQIHLGVAIDRVEVLTVAPQFVKKSFDRVIEAGQDRNKKIEDARGEGQKITLEAVGEAARLIDTARSASNSLVQGLAGEAQLFTDQVGDYRKSPHLVRERLRLASIERVFTNSAEKWYLPEHTTELRLNLSREPEVPTKK